MGKNAVIISALAASFAAGAFCFASAAAADVATNAGPPEIAEPAPEGPTTSAPYDTPRYFNPYTPRQDNPTNPPGTWEVYPSPTSNNLYCVDFVDANNGWAGGRSVALRYQNGTWSVIPGHSGHVFEDIDMLSSSYGWAVGWDGNKELPAIWRWNGTDWIEFQNPTGAVYCIDMINASNGWIGGNGYFLRFNGTNWVVGGTATRAMYGIDMLSDTSGIAVGSRAIMRRTGSNWIEDYYNDNWVLAGVRMINGNRVWGSGYTRAGEYGLIIEYNGVWREYKIFINSDTIADLDIYGDNYGWFAGQKNASPPYGGFIGFYDGQNWYEVNSPTNNGLAGIRILNSNDAWIVGYYGTILKYKPNVSVRQTSLGKIKAVFR